MAWKYFLHYWYSVRGIHQSVVDSPHKEPVMLSFDVPLLLPWMSFWTNSQGSSLRCYDVHANFDKCICYLAAIIFYVMQEVVANHYFYLKYTVFFWIISRLGGGGSFYIHGTIFTSQWTSFQPVSIISMDLKILPYQLLMCCGILWYHVGSLEWYHWL